MKLTAAIPLALALTAILHTPARAGLFDWFDGWFDGKDAKWGGRPAGVPEIDPGVVRSLLVILGGGVLILRERRRRG